MLTSIQDEFLYQFEAMASPCEVRFDTADAALAEELGRLAQSEARRIEQKYSRYLPNSVLSQINRSGGDGVTLDDETCDLIDYAAACFDLSKGRFDITSGVLRRAWRFDGSDRLPTPEAVTDLLVLVGWNKVSWERPRINLPAGVELDLGGIGKEYAVDSVIAKIQAKTDTPVLVNFGGDLRVSGPRSDGSRWRIAIQSIDATREMEGLLAIADGAITTSGDATRFLVRNGVRYSHILDPRSGWPVQDPPRSVTVAAQTCMEAGTLSTLAMLHGSEAERFLESEGVLAWCIR